LSTLESKRTALCVARELLKPRGKLLIGYHDLEERYRFAPEFAEGFEADRIPGMPAVACVTADPLKHCFVCFAKVRHS